MKEYGGIDSKFRYVILASMRAKELLRGAKPKIKTKSKNLIRVAQEETMKGLIQYELVKPGEDEIYEVDDSMFIGEEIGVSVEEAEPEVTIEPEPEPEPEVEAKADEKPEEEATLPEKAKDKLKKEKEALKEEKKS